RFAGGRPIPVSASWVTSPVARPMSILPSARSGAFSVLPLVLRCSTASVASISFRTAEYAAPYTWKPPPGVAVPSTTTVFCCAAAWFKPPLMIATASAKIAGATGVRSPPSPVCLFMFVVSHLPQRVDSRAALLYHAPTLQRPGAEWRKFSRGSVRTRAGGLDYAAPLQRLVPHELLQVLRRASDRPRALRDERGAQLRRGDCLHERHVQLVDDFARRSGRRDHGMPGRAEHAREPDFRRRRDVGQARRANSPAAPGWGTAREAGSRRATPARSPWRRRSRACCRGPARARAARRYPTGACSRPAATWRPFRCLSSLPRRRGCRPGSAARARPTTTGRPGARSRPPIRPRGRARRGGSASPDTAQRRRFRKRERPEKEVRASYRPGQRLVAIQSAI